MHHLHWQHEYNPFYIQSLFGELQWSHLQRHPQATWLERVKTWFDGTTIQKESQIPRVHRMNQGHLHRTSLRILALFNFNSNPYFIKHSNGCHRRRWRQWWYRDGIVLRIELRISLEHHQTFNTQPKQTRSSWAINLVRGEKGRGAHFDTLVVEGRRCTRHARVLFFCELDKIYLTTLDNDIVEFISHIITPLDNIIRTIYQISND